MKVSELCQTLTFVSQGSPYVHGADVCGGHPRVSGGGAAGTVYR